MQQHSTANQFSPSSKKTRNGRQWFRGWRFVLLFSLLLVIALLVGWTIGSAVFHSSSQPATASIASPTAGGGVSLFSEPNDGIDPVLDELAAAQHSIDVEVYLLSDERVISALEQAVERGIAVRVMLEQHPFGGAGTEKTVKARLEKSGVDIQWSNPVYRFSHIKMIVVDRQTAIILSLNLSRSAFTGNRDFGVITTRPDDVAHAQAIFDADWARTDPPPGPLIFSPVTSRSTLLGMINQAQQSLDIYAEVMRDREIIDALIQAVDRGVTVRLIMSANTVEGTAERLELATAGVQVRIVNRPYIHAKMVLVDRQQGFIGSQNFTSTSLDQNREVGIILTDTTNLYRLQRLYDDDFAAGLEEQ